MPNVLVVDDTTIDRTLAGGLLSKSPNVTVHYAEHGAAALEALRGADFDLVVTDLQMPEVDGLELVTRIRMVHPALPVILMTAQGSEEIAVEALEQGAAGYVPKSQLAELLLPTAEQVLAMSQTEHANLRLMQCQQSMECRFALDNDRALIDALVEQIQHTIEGMGIAEHTERLRICVALREAMLNAMLHGNFELSRADLEIAPQQVESRAEEAPYCDRKIHVHASISEQAQFVVRDEGPGFDAAAYASRDLSSPESLQQDTGRGIILMQTFMDEVNFNDAGNEVTLVKRRLAED